MERSLLSARVFFTLMLLALFPSMPVPAAASFSSQTNTTYREYFDGAHGYAQWPPTVIRGQTFAVFFYDDGETAYYSIRIEFRDLPKRCWWFICLWGEYFHPVSNVHESYDVHPLRMDAGISVDDDTPLGIYRIRFVFTGTAVGSVVEDDHWITVEVLERPSTTCPDGQYWDGSQCVCPSDQHWDGQQCVSNIPTCYGGQYWDGSRCVCPSGQEWNGQQCVTVPQQASLSVSVGPNPVAIESGKNSQVTYVFIETSGVGVHVTSRDWVWVLSDGSRVSSGSGSNDVDVRPNSSASWVDAPYLPPDIVQRSQQLESSTAVLATTFHGTDSNGNRVDAQEVRLTITFGGVPPSNECGRIVSIEGGGITVFSIMPQTETTNVWVYAFPMQFLGQDPTTQIPTEYDVGAIIEVTYCQNGNSKYQDMRTPLSLTADHGTPITLSVLSPSGFACVWDHYAYAQYHTCTLSIDVTHDDKIVAYFNIQQLLIMPVFDVLRIQLLDNSVPIRDESTLKLRV